MLSRASIVVVSANILIAVSSPSWAWGPEGHAIVADIAEGRLTPQAQSAVVSLLAQENHQHLDQVASWADDVRPSQPKTAPWHFVDIPLSAPAYDPARDCAQGACVVVKIVEFSAALANPSTDPAKRLEALKWVVHFVGDVHQPLHAEDDDDKGGNTVSISYFGKHTNLHAVWDGGIIEHATGLSVGPHFSIDLRAVAQVASQLGSNVNNEQATQWAPQGILSNLQPVAIGWANESHGLAQSIAYGDLPRPPVGNWSAAYQDESWPVVQIQLEKAGVRLAELLNEALR